MASAGAVAQREGAGNAWSFWPPLTSPAVPAVGVTGKLTMVSDARGTRSPTRPPAVLIRSDHPGQVTGQGVQDFFVATPGLAPIGSSAAPSGGALVTPSGTGYSY